MAVLDVSLRCLSVRCTQTSVEFPVTGDIAGHDFQSFIALVYKRHLYYL